mmetsp:Transcript_23626/g.20994  ORF Transcript_23626/g.20994 Transcript_23626/m.20994 type:complete len:161 (-) Transcript_23626:86-568(-)
MEIIHKFINKGDKQQTTTKLRKSRSFAYKPCIKPNIKWAKKISRICPFDKDHPSIFIRLYTLKPQKPSKKPLKSILKKTQVEDKDTDASSDICDEFENIQNESPVKRRMLRIPYTPIRQRMQKRSRSLAIHYFCEDNYIRGPRLLRSRFLDRKPTRAAWE